MIIASIIEELKKVNDELEEQIKSAHLGLRNNTLSRCRIARTKVQEAITELLEAN